MLRSAALIGLLAFSPAYAASPPAGVVNSTWALAVWNLQYNAGPSGIASYSVPGVAAYPSGCTVSLSGTNLTISAGTCSFYGWNFTSLGVTVTGGTPSFSNSKFDAGSGGFYALDVYAAATVSVVKCSFDGLSSTAANPAALLNVRGGSGHVIFANSFKNASSDSVDLTGASNTLFIGNYLLGGGWRLGAHADQIAIAGNATNNTVKGNVFDGASYGPAGLSSSFRIDPFDNTQTVNIVFLTNNIFVNSGNIYYTSYSSEQGSTFSYGLTSNVVMANNLWGTPIKSWFYTNTASASANASPSGISISLNNLRLSDGTSQTEMPIGNP